MMSSVCRVASTDPWRPRGIEIREGTRVAVHYQSWTRDHRVSILHVEVEAPAAGGDTLSVR